MALPEMPTRDPKRATDEPEHSRQYSASSGGWTKPVAKPKPAARG
ncbi:hypothetical protein [Streptomyces sp. SBT349]|nr:hypothetical protein [Streptomyces sp. SBT349]